MPELLHGVRYSDVVGENDRADAQTPGRLAKPGKGFRCAGRVLLLGAIAVSLAIAGCGDSHPRKTASSLTAPLASSTHAASHTRRSNWSFGPFAGCSWYGHVQSVGASWAAPRVVPGSSPGVAGTWIGAQGPSTSRGTPFIQIGVTEQTVTPSAKRPARASFEAFWSTTSHGFHPQLLFPVNPGDDISATLTLTHERWKLVLIDATSGAVAHISTESEARASFIEAMWIQEDVTNQATGKPFAYPQLTPTSFRRLAVDSIPPAYTALYSQWMSANGSSLAPSPLQRDSFTLQEATVSSAGEQYLDIAKSEDAATLALLAQLGEWSPTTPRPQIASASRALLSALRGDASALARYPWPARVRGLVASLVRADDAMLTDLEAVKSTPASGLTAWISRFERDAAIGDTGHMIRSALDLPEPGPHT
jgi:hypothetical protein